jgi:hypothetical protein
MGCGAERATCTLPSCGAPTQLVPTDVVERLRRLRILRSAVLLTPLELPGWVEFNVWRTGLKAHRFAFASTPDGPEIRAVLYLDRRGRVRVPLNNPFLPIAFESARRSSSGRTADWLKVSAPLVEEMRRRGVVNATSLPPDVEDVRPWGWRGFRVGVGYTYLLDFPFDPALADRGARRNCEKAARLGMTVERIRDADPVVECLTETESRKGFSHLLGPRELRAADSLLGPDSLRMYACFDRGGQAASSCIVIHAPGTRAVAWLAGTKTTFLPSGAGHLLWRYVFDDLSAAGATNLDFCGANIGPIADFKSRWNPVLTPTYNVRTYSVRAGARFLAEWLKSKRPPATG